MGGGNLIVQEHQKLLGLVEEHLQALPLLFQVLDLNEVSIKRQSQDIAMKRIHTFYVDFFLCCVIQLHNCDFSPFVFLLDVSGLLFFLI